MRKLIAFFVAALLLYAANNMNPYDFKKGDILYPDLGVEDTMIVVDADGLNSALNDNENVVEAVKKYCKPLNP